MIWDLNSNMCRIKKCITEKCISDDSLYSLKKYSHIQTFLFYYANSNSFIDVYGSFQFVRSGYIRNV